ncbi:Ni/Fe hydrogenase subunit alpha [Accumulibacter sp.]|uniref:Ni/Fe hydrogenase subunit alpha n=1 Tax=Accumulibacter sp. TaxID=2053492 RepID=UPI0025E81B1C|nr:Ni/Fe hydrogenase subunit alpha [Accumulibacter sp.]MCM8594215.1 Ni/Fe hydrogenase subunit alpha [Accumulibacter sp.]MCM8625780.1 Ni/Fe hydrogenase subunit alpha [Accumulibacter sp.]MDS4048358.1 Ni/Fe hydrogenase subunit alpha [Accumulibacter sp.]
MDATSPRTLETAPPGDTELRRVSIDPLSRVEGHGKITLLLDADDRVQQVRLHIVEFRGFEKFIQGRPYWEVPVMVQRLCGICPVSHHLAAAKALDHVVGAERLTPTAEKVRRLMHYGQILQSHALHFFHLASPDLLFGFASDATRRNIVGIAAAYPEVARQGVLLRRFGQEIIRLTAGKRIHGTGAIPGGVNRALGDEERAALLAEIYTIIGWSRQSVHLVKRLHTADPELYDGFGTTPSNLLSLVGAGGALDFYDGRLRARDAGGKLLVDGCAVRNYPELIGEEVKPWSYMKFPFLAALGPERGWYKVGPLARVQNCDSIATPLAEAERREFVDHGQGRPIHAPLAYHWARMIEMLHAAEAIKNLLHDDELSGSELLTAGPRHHEGIGVIEAPRGTLIHHYQVDDDDLVTMCNLIVSTTHNNQPMNEAIREVARRHLDGRRLGEGLLNHIEVAIRAFDPCLSCATHALGRMPLEVELVDCLGQRIAQLRSSG